MKENSRKLHRLLLPLGALALGASPLAAPAVRSRTRSSRRRITRNDYLAERPTSFLFELQARPARSETARIVF
jgi:hypothetical protein